MKPKEEAVKGLKRILDSRLAPPGMDGKIQWNVGELLSNWYRPNFDAMMYPYLPAVCTYLPLNNILIIPIACKDAQGTETDLFGDYA